MACTVHATIFSTGDNTTSSDWMLYFQYSSRILTGLWVSIGVTRSYSGPCFYALLCQPSVQILQHINVGGITCIDSHILALMYVT